MNTRRSFLKQSHLFLMTSAVGSLALAQLSKNTGTHSHAGHTGHGGNSHKALSPQVLNLQKSADHCLDVGKTCLAHCNVLMAGEDASMAACQMAVMNMLSVTQSVSEISHYNSFDKGAFSHLVKACIEMCKKCESECKKHADRHDECKACMEACQKCIKSCEVYLKS